MKCRILRHFIWVFTVCQNTPIGVSTLQRVNYPTENVHHLSPGTEVIKLVFILNSNEHEIQLLIKPKLLKNNKDVPCFQTATILR